MKLSMMPSEDELASVSELANALAVFGIIIIELSARGMNLAKADAQFEWVLQSFKYFETSIAARLAQAFIHTPGLP